MIWIWTIDLDHDLAERPWRLQENRLEAFSRESKSISARMRRRGAASPRRPTATSAGCYALVLTVAALIRSCRAIPCIDRPLGARVIIRSRVW